MLTISGVYAEDIDSSVVAESPFSAGVETCLSSCDAFNNDLSNSYEPSDSLSYESYDSYESLDYTPQINDEINYLHSNSYSCCEYYNIAVIDVKYDSYDESIDVPDDVDYTVFVDDSCNYDEFIDVSVVNVDSYVDCGLLSVPVIDVEDVELNSAINVVVNDDNVILNKSNSCSNYFVVLCPTNFLDEINISAFEYLDREIDVNIDDKIISEVTFDIETSESYKLIRDVTQVNNLLNFENADAVLAINVSGIPIGEASEPVFDGILRVSEYISKGKEIYFGTLSESDREKLLKSVGSENTLLFASIAKWYSGVTFDMQEKQANHGQILLEDFLDGYTVTKALLQYDSLSNELYVYIINSEENEDEYSHVINDTNSHGLDYAYAKHVKVNNKDMLKLFVLISYGDDFEEEPSAAGSWGGLNDVLGAEMPSETLLPDHKAIWTPLLLLQLDLKESDVASHAGDNENKNKTKCKCDADHRCRDCNCTIDKCSCCKKSHHKCKHCHHKRWGPDIWPPCYHITSDVVPKLTLDDSAKNSTNNKTNSSGNFTSTKKGKFFDSPKSEVNGNEPTYTLVYAIIGIVLVTLLFNSSYMKRDD